MKKRELEEELRIWRFIGTHNVRFVDELKVPVVTPRKHREWEYLFQLSKETN